NIFLAKFDPNGNELWAKGVGGNNNDIVISITKDNLNNIYVSGVFRSIILQFELKTLTNISGYTDSFINKLFPKEIAGFEYLTYLDIHPDIVNDKLSFNIPDYSKSFDYILEHSICLPINVEIFNVEGIMLREFVVEQNNTVFNISELPKGIYFSKMENADGTVVGKFIKE
ncbi:MAG: T9SS type A sorting domain-containing protein, partial [Bacteroidota bacterium]